MTTRKTFSFAILTGLGLVVSMITPAAASPPSVTVEKAIHFPSPAGDDVLVGPATYQLEMLGKSGIRLRTSGKEPLVIEAQMTKDAVLIEPPAVVIPDREDSDTQHLAMQLSDGRALFATGSLTNVRSRRVSRDPADICVGLWPICKPKPPVR